MVHIRQEKGTQTQMFWSGYLWVGWGFFHVKGRGPKSSVCPSKPRETKTLAGYPRIFGGISRECPKSLRKKRLCSISRPYHTVSSPQELKLGGPEGILWSEGAVLGTASLDRQEILVGFDGTLPLQCPIPGCEPTLRVWSLALPTCSNPQGEKEYTPPPSFLGLSPDPEVTDRGPI